MPFLWTRDTRWTLSFLGGLAGIAGVTMLLYGWSPFADFLHNAANIYAANTINFRENSVDSLVRSTGLVWDVAIPPAVVVVLKIPLLIVIAVTAAANSRDSTFLGAQAAGSRILNSVPALLVLMLLASPLVFEH